MNHNLYEVYFYGKKFFSSGDYVNAIELLTFAVKKGEGKRWYPYAQYLLGLSHYLCNEENVSETLTAFEIATGQADQSEPWFNTAKHILGVIYLKQHDYATAREHFLGVGVEYESYSEVESLVAECEAKLPKSLSII